MNLVPNWHYIYVNKESVQHHQPFFYKYRMYLIKKSNLTILMFNPTVSDILLGDHTLAGTILLTYHNNHNT